MSITNGSAIKIMNHNGQMVKKWIHNGVQVFSAAQPVTYKVDSSVSYKEDVNYGETCLSPKTFTPTKSGYTFVGWRDDNTATASVHSTKTMGDSPITLYAVFKKDITLTFVSYNNTKTIHETMYYNNGNTDKPDVVTPNLAPYDNWTSRGWGSNGVTAAGADVYKKSGDTISNVTEDRIYYGLYLKEITLSYNGNGNTGGSVSSRTGNVTYNASGEILGATFELASNGFTKRSHTFQKWAKGSASGTQYAAGSSVTITESTKMYAVWGANAYKYLLSYGKAEVGNTSDKKDASIPSSSGYWKIEPKDGYVTFKTPIDTSNLTKIKVMFNDSRNETAQLQVYLPTSPTGGKTNKIGDTGSISTPNGAIVKEFDISTLTGTRYVTIACPSATNNLTLWEVAYV